MFQLLKFSAKGNGITNQKVHCVTQMTSTDDNLRRLKRKTFGKNTKSRLMMNSPLLVTRVEGHRIHVLSRVCRQRTKDRNDYWLGVGDLNEEESVYRNEKDEKARGEKTMTESKGKPEGRITRVLVL